MVDREGPALTDERGELREPYLSCSGCKWLRIHDWHYFYCRDLGDKSKPDMNAYNGGMERIWRHPRPHDERRFIPVITD